jgi:hypothetical protein
MILRIKHAYYLLFTWTKQHDKREGVRCVDQGEGRSETSLRQGCQCWAKCWPRCCQVRIPCKPKLAFSSNNWLLWYACYSPRESNRFRVSVNVGAKEKVTFRLVYEELLLRKVGRYEQRITIDPGQVIWMILQSFFGHAQATLLVLYVQVLFYPLSLFFTSSFLN